MIAFGNAVLHRGYEGALGELRAHQVSSVVLLLLLAPWVRWVERRHPLPTAAGGHSSWPVLGRCDGCLEFGFGRYVNRDSWATLLNAYDLREGRLWLFDVIGIACAPALARAWRLHRNG